MNARHLPTLLLLGALWGGSFPFIRVAVPALGPICLIELRVGLAGLALLLLALLRGGLPAPGASFREYLALAALNAAVPFVLYAGAMYALPASLAAILNATVPLFGALAAFLWLEEPLGLTRVAGLLAGLLGVASLLGLGPVPVTPATVLAVGGALAASAMYASAAVYTRKRFAGASTMALATYSNLGAALLLLPLVPFAWPAAMPGPVVWGCVLALAWGSTGIAYLLYFHLIASVGAVRAVAVTYLVPVFGIFWGWMYLGEPVGWGLAPGIGLIALSLYLINRRSPSAA